MDIVVHIYSETLFSHKNGMNLRQMNLKPVIQSEVSLKEKNKYHIVTQIHMESIKNVSRILMNLSAGQE